MNKKVFLFLVIGIFLNSLVLAITINETTINYSTPDASIKLYAQNHTTFGKNNGESIELHGLFGTSKPYIGWYGYDPLLGYNTPLGWIGCHYNLTNGNVHQHCSWETLDNNTGKPTINTKFEISYGSNQTQANRGSFAQFTSINQLRLGSGVDLWFNSGKILHKSTLDIYPNNQRDVGLRIGKNSNSVFLLGLGTDTIEFQDMIRLKPNITGVNCNSINEGNIYYNGLTKKHYGCNGTNWNSLD